MRQAAKKKVAMSAAKRWRVSQETVAHAAARARLLEGNAARYYASHYYLPFVWRLTTSALDESESVSCREGGYALPGLYSN